MATFGKTAIGGSTSTRGGNTVTGSKFTLSDSATVTQMSWYGANAGVNTNAVVGIYTNSAGAPGTLLGTSSATAINSATPQWWTFTISLALSPGDYWLCFLPQGTVDYYWDNVANASVVDNSGVTYPTFSSPFSVDATQSREVSIYATYTAATSLIKALSSVAQANIKKVSGVALASMKKIGGVANT